MCSHYQAIKERARLEKFGVVLPPEWSPPHQIHVYKRYLAPFISASPSAAVPSYAEGEFGLLPHWSAERLCKFETLNARAEAAAVLPSFRLPWAQRHCIIPADWINEPDWRSGRAIDTAIARADGEPLGIAGLWDAWRDPSTGEVVRSFTMLTINADDHPLMQRFHRADNEKRMVVVLPESHYLDWLDAPAEHSMEFMKPYPADALVTRTFNTQPERPKPAVKPKRPDRPPPARQGSTLDLWPES
jgi:putative SOS response-associated peptidase YedK